MNYNQNNKIAQITSQTLIIGVDIGYASSNHCFIRFIDHISVRSIWAIRYPKLERNCEKCSHSNGYFSIVYFY
jgi:hypothetical protein